MIGGPKVRWHEMAVHDIKVNPVSTSVIDWAATLLANSPKSDARTDGANNVICQLFGLFASADPKKFFQPGNGAAA